jgi:hypothetical protein
MVGPRTWCATVRQAQARGGAIVNHDDKLIPLETILRTEELDRRQSRPPDFEQENSSLVALTQALSDHLTPFFRRWLTRS